MRLTSTDGTRIGHEIAGAGPGVVLVDRALCRGGGGPTRPLAAHLIEAATAARAAVSVTTYAGVS